MTRLASPALCVSLVALVVAATPVADAADIVKKSLFAQNAATVGGVKVSKTPKAGRILPLGKNGKFPASVVPAGARGPAGATGPQGPAGPAGPVGASGTNATLTGVAAGGALAGTYPNPTLATGAVTPATFGTIPQARAGRATAYSVPNSGVPNVPLDTETFDTTDMHSTTVQPHCIKPTLAGVYSITATVRWQANNTASRFSAISIDGAWAASSWVTATQGQPTDQNVATVAKVDADQCVSLVVYQDSGGAVDLVQTGVQAPNLTLTWVGKG
jgi:hypothetical protein